MLRTSFQIYSDKAEKFLEKLQQKCTTKTICENYGQKEISKFIDKMENDRRNHMTYQELCDVKRILYRVSSITPKK